MIISNFIMFSALCTPIQQSTAFSAVVVKESSANVCAINDNGLLQQPSLFGKTVVKNEQYTQNGHNFDVYWEKNNNENLKWFYSFFSTLLAPYRDFKVVQTALKHCCEQISPHYSIRQAVLNFHNIENFKNGFANADVQKISSHIEMKTSTFVDKESQKLMKLQRENEEQIIELESLSLFLEEDAFTHKASGVHDAFKTENSSLVEPSLEEQQEQ
ncbi:hypothetical protein ME7_00949 [Bartonella birtlesii LL-WM9]|uniref:Uncharacterized protein n=1 Tax=Bartonella birtlesii LL-WM9 TaxID=1094552 RepID=J1IYR8_9HYPH|nr:hypothetical protein [Bartonella birtlesii]EJF76405.1 hypothetical protein ME7_00949 [Bartonella birtlesii LL-WM9]